MRIKEMIEAKGLTVAEVARRMEVAPNSVVSMIKGNPTAGNLIKLAAVLGCRVGEFFEEDGGLTYGGNLEEVARHPEPSGAAAVVPDPGALSGLVSAVENMAEAVALMARSVERLAEHLQGLPPEVFREEE